MGAMPPISKPKLNISVTLNKADLTRLITEAVQAEHPNYKVVQVDYSVYDGNYREGPYLGNAIVKLEPRQ